MYWLIGSICKTCSVSKQTSIIEVLQILIKNLFNMVINWQSKLPDAAVVDEDNPAFLGSIM